MTEKISSVLNWERIKLRITSPSFNNVGLFIALVAMGTYFATQSPYYLSVRNFLNIGNAVAIRGTVAAGLTMVMISVGLDISIAGSAGGVRPGIPDGRSCAEAVVFELWGRLDAFEEVWSKEA